MNKETIMPKSFRISVETAEKFKEIAAELGGSNQEQTMAKLIEVFETQNAKTVYSDRSSEIEEFDGLLSALQRIYINSVETAKESLVVARAEQEGYLKAKDNEIVRLNGEIAMLQLIAEDSDKMKEEIKKLSAENDNLQKKYQTETKQLQTTINALSSENARLQLQASKESYRVEDALEKLSILRKTNDSMELQNKDYRNQLEALEKQRIQSVTELEKLRQDIKVLIEKNETIISEEKERVKELEEKLTKQFVIEKNEALLNKEMELAQKYEDMISKYREEADKYKELFFNEKMEQIKEKSNTN